MYADTVQVCASKLGVQAEVKKVGMMVHTPLAHAFSKATQAAKVASACAGNIQKMVKAARADTTRAPNEKSKLIDAAPVADVVPTEEGLVESIALAAGAAITSAFGYGMYWLLTQG